jgi:hypothetical protein
MIETQEGLAVSLEQLTKLRAWEKEIVNDLNQHPRLKKSELAGIRRMIAQIEREVQSYNLSRLQSTINELEEQAQKLKAEELPTLLSQKIRAIREAAAAMQPVM